MYFELGRSFGLIHCLWHCLDPEIQNSLLYKQIYKQIYKENSLFTGWHFGSVVTNQLKDVRSVHQDVQV